MGQPGRERLRRALAWVALTGLVGAALTVSLLFALRTWSASHYQPQIYAQVTEVPSRSAAIVFLSLIHI